MIKKSTRTWLLGVVISSTLFAMLQILPTSAYAASSDDSEYNFSWLDPEKKVYVLQNRKYRKAKHVSLFLSGGMNLSNPFKKEFAGIPRVGFWFTENMGIEAFYAHTFASDNDTLRSLRKVSASALPFVRETRSYMGLVFSWVPWYSKLNFFNKILYMDWSINAGLGRINTQVDLNNRASGVANWKAETFTSFYYGTAMNFFVSRNWSVRFDMIGMAYSANGADNETKRTNMDYDFAAGVGYLF